MQQKFVYFIKWHSLVYWTSESDTRYNKEDNFVEMLTNLQEASICLVMDLI